MALEAQPAGVGGAGGGRTASIVNQLLLSDQSHHLPAAARLSVSLEVPEPRRVGIYTVTKEEIGFFRKAIPCMTRSLAWLCLCLNVILPGSGTLISSFACLRGAKTSYNESKKKAFYVNMLAAVLQFLTSPILIGFIWSIMWGMNFVKHADDKN